MAVAALAAWGGAALAQTAPAPVTPSRQEINPIERTPAPAPRRQEDLFAAPPPPPCPLRESKLTFRLTGVDVKGAAGVSDRDIAEITRGEVGREIPVAEICEIRDRLSSLLFHRGLLARVEVPEQTVAGGRLELDVIEARIVTVRVHGDIGPAQDLVEGYLDKLRGLTPFDLNTAQRYLLLANDVPGVHVTAALRPSPQGRGAVDLDVQVTRDPVDYLVSIQNTGSKALGPWSVLGRVDLNSFTRLGDRTTLIVYSTLGNNEQQVIQGLEEVRLGTTGVVARGSVAYGISRPGDVLAPLHLRGTSMVGTAELDYPVIRHRLENLSGGVGLDIIDQTTKFPGGARLIDDHLRVVWVRAQSDGFHRFANGVAISGSGQIEFRQGLEALGASRPNAPNLSRLGARPGAWDMRFTAEGHLFPVPKVDLAVDFQALYANQPLLSYEQLEIGELTIGRGYDPAAVTGDRGAATEVRAEFGPFPIGPWAALSPYAFYDYAYVNNLALGTENRTVRSEGLGLKLRMPFGLRADLAYAVPLDRTFIAAAKPPSSKLLFQLVLSR